MLDLNKIEDKIIFDEPMKNHTSFKIGGKADLFFKASSIEDVKQILKYAKEKNIKINIIGNGSNILVTDKGVRGLILKINIQTVKINKQKEDAEVIVGAGNKLMALAIKMKEEGLSGLEELSGIPRKYRWSNIYECRSIW